MVAMLICSTARFVHILVSNYRAPFGRKSYLMQVQVLDCNEEMVVTDVLNSGL
jgi:hypothetical protein